MLFGIVYTEGSLQRALQDVVAEARRRGWETVGRMSLQLFDASDVVHLAEAARHVPASYKKAKGMLSYEVKGYSFCEIQFDGLLDEFEPVRNFFHKQLRMAMDSAASFSIIFSWFDGLPLDAIEELRQQFIQAGVGAVDVEITADARPPLRAA